MELYTFTWTEVRESNNLSPPNGFRTGEAAGDIDSTFREMMAALKRDWDRSHPTLSFGGATNLWTLTPSTAITEYVQGQIFAAKATADNYDSTFGGLTLTQLLSISGVGANIIYVPTLSGYVALTCVGMIKSGMPVFIEIETSPTKFIMMSQPAYELALEEIPCPITSEVGLVTAGVSKFKFRLPYAFLVTDVKASLSTTQTSGNILTIDINISSSSILSTKLTIDNGEKTSETASAAAIINTLYDHASDDMEVSIDVDQVGDGTATGLKVTLLGYQR